MISWKHVIAGAVCAGISVSVAAFAPIGTHLVPVHSCETASGQVASCGTIDEGGLNFYVGVLGYAALATLFFGYAYAVWRSHRGKTQ